jgi:NAD-dependent deacetylase
MRASGLSSELRERLASARQVVVFTGAGVSQESGISTFRDPGGLWERYRPEDLATPEAFVRDPALVWRWYRDRYRAMRAAEPNPAHLTIARWEERFPSLLVVTQNVDRLHQRAGSSEVVELHGTIWESHCNRCEGRTETAGLIEGELPPRCPCGGLYRPSVVWFGEILPQVAFGRALDACRRADLLLSVGTSALVWPAAGLIEVAATAGALVIEVNREPSALSELCHAGLLGPAGEILPALAAELDARAEPG